MIRTLQDNSFARRENPNVCTVQRHVEGGGDADGSSRRRDVLPLVSHRRAPSRLPSPSLPPPRHPAIVPRPSSLVVAAPPVTSPRWFPRLSPILATLATPHNQFIQSFVRDNYILSDDNGRPVDANGPHVPFRNDMSESMSDFHSDSLAAFRSSRLHRACITIPYHCLRCGRGAKAQEGA